MVIHTVVLTSNNQQYKYTWWWGGSSYLNYCSKESVVLHCKSCSVSSNCLITGNHLTNYIEVTTSLENRASASWYRLIILAGIWLFLSFVIHCFFLSFFSFPFTMCVLLQTEQYKNIVTLCYSHCFFSLFFFFLFFSFPFTVCVLLQTEQYKNIVKLCYVSMITWSRDIVVIGCSSPCVISCNIKVNLTVQIDTFRYKYRIVLAKSITRNEKTSSEVEWGT